MKAVLIKYPVDFAPNGFVLSLHVGDTKSLEHLINLSDNKHFGAEVINVFDYDRLCVLFDNSNI